MWLSNPHPFDCVAIKRMGSCTPFFGSENKQLDAEANAIGIRASHVESASSRPVTACLIVFSFPSVFDAAMKIDSTKRSLCSSDENIATHGTVP